MNADLEQIYQKYSRQIFHFLLSLGADPALGEDLMQETFLKAAENIHSYRHESSLSSWLCAIARNLYLDSKKKQKQTIEVEEIFLPSFDQRRDLRIFGCLHRMEEPFREIVYLRTFAQMSFRDIGEIFARSDSWARVMYFRGKKKLLSLWEEESENEQ